MPPMPTPSVTFVQPEFYSDILLEGRVCEAFRRPLQSKYYARSRNSQAGPQVLPHHELPIDDYAISLATHMLTDKGPRVLCLGRRAQTVEAS